MLHETTTKQFSPDKTNTAHHTQSETKVKNDMFSATKLSEDALVALSFRSFLLLSGAGTSSAASSVSLPSSLGAAAAIVVSRSNRQPHNTH